VSRFWVFCSRNAMRNVTCDAAVFIVNCHVSENRNTGPRKSHRAVNARVALNAHGEPTADAVTSAMRLNPFVMRSSKEQEVDDSRPAVPAERRPLFAQTDHLVASSLALRVSFRRLAFRAGSGG
jgi:hypothetical protein